MNMNRQPLYIIATLLFIGLTVLNTAAILSVFDPGAETPSDVLEVGQIDGEPADDTLEGELVEDVGGITQVTGIPTFFLALFMIGISVGLLRGANWAVVGALVTLGIDVVLKLIILVAELAAGTPLPDQALNMAIIIVDLALIVIFQRYSRYFTSRTTTQRQEPAAS